MQIHWRHPSELSGEERAAVDERIRSLANGHSDLIDVWIDVEPHDAHHRAGDKHATIRGSVRRGRLVARAEGAHFEIALRKALEKFERNVWCLRERRSGRRRVSFLARSSP